MRGSSLEPASKAGNATSRYTLSAASSFKASSVLIFSNSSSPILSYTNLNHTSNPTTLLKLLLSKERWLILPTPVSTCSHPYLWAAFDMADQSFTSRYAFFPWFPWLPISWLSSYLTGCCYSLLCWFLLFLQRFWSWNAPGSNLAPHIISLNIYHLRDLIWSLI